MKILKLNAESTSHALIQTARNLFVILLLLFLPAMVFAQFGELVSPGELSKAHQKYSGIKNCNVCHGPDQNVLDAKCLDCHKELAARIKANQGFHADKKTQCITCHSEHLGKDFDIRQLDLKKFSHDQTGWPLAGLHARITDCAACHKTRSFLGLSTDCTSCHKDPHLGRLPDCTRCHAVDRPMKQVTYDHSKTAFPLAGGHATVPCMQCHKNQVFKGLPFANCTSCHIDPHKPSLGSNCTTCHNVESWKKPTVAHKTFPLNGKHASVACVKCHAGNQWKLKTPFAKCADCHRDPHLGQFPGKDCASCHNVQGFKPAVVDHSSFKLELGHAVACVKCHKLEKGMFPSAKGETIRYKPIATACVTCHKDIHKGQFGKQCESCHNIQSFKLQAFDHSKSRFPLDKVHAKVPCASCHKQDPKTGATIYKPLEITCNSCHVKAHMGQLTQKCEQCHKPDGNIQFDHATSRFPLTGKHSPLTCDKCHKLEKGTFPSGAGEAIRYKPMSLACASCHEDQHRGQFKKDCVQCHNTDNFKPSTFNHARSVFPLIGAHARIECSQCHKLETFASPPPAVQRVRYHPLDTSCAKCHTDPHQGRLGSDCTSCHTTENWRIVSRAFHKTVKFPLEGAHLSVACESCHLNGVTKGTPTRCYDCHWIRRQDDLYRTKLGIECAVCHSTTSWTGGKFDHAVQAHVPLNGSHKVLSCDSCHQSGAFTPGEVQCISCHQEDYNNTTAPNHRAAGYPTTCQGCHNPGDNTWHTRAINHNQIFPLVGRHAQITCDQCHKNGVFQGTPRNCVGCHKQDYDRTTSPNHAASGFPTTCDSCHKSTDPDWNRAKFNHDNVFPLVGTHKTLDCSACHKNGVYRGTPRDCYGCHKTAYDNTKDPNHKSSGFSTNCESCHKATDPNWNTTFNHDSIFPLVGTHKNIPCSACHKNGKYQGTPSTCYGCHKVDYDSTREPNHVSAGFPTTCQNCHNPSDPNWNNGFDHNKVFPLVGQHRTITCDACHKNGRYQGTPRTCYGCHKADYDATRSPNHVSAGFPTNCEACHQASAPNWNAKFDHNKFFQLVGVHNTIPCEACHKNGKYQGTPTTCYGCHKPDYDATRDPNHAAAGFPTTCDNCHRASDPNWNTSFDHNKFFALVGQHRTLACQACHKNGKYQVLQLHATDATKPITIPRGIRIMQPPDSQPIVKPVTRRRIQTGTRLRSITIRSFYSPAGIHKFLAKRVTRTAYTGVLRGIAMDVIKPIMTARAIQIMRPPDSPRPATIVTDTPIAPGTRACSITPNSR